ncbi:hypothetical protein RhiirB3_208375 [Rhizophagus irregularis]|nr:hypothetical protein RhiirB3_208375 [Rhizophagus irregularis]
MPSQDFNIMPSVDINVMVVGLTTRTVTNINGQSTLNFYIEGDRELNKFWIEAKHNAW